MNKNSFVCIPADKLVEIIEHCCPPNMSVDNCDGRSCINCWAAWLKDGE